MSGQYKLAWLCEALLVSRSGYYDWKERRRQPGPRQIENTHLRARIRGVSEGVSQRKGERRGRFRVLTISIPEDKEKGCLGRCGWNILERSTTR